MGINFEKTNNIYEKKSIVFSLLCCAFVVIFMFSIFHSYNLIVSGIRMAQYEKNILRYEKIKNERGFSSLKEINPNILAWITIKDLNISLPIVKTASRDDENFYLDHDFEKYYNPLGTPYQKCDSNIFSTENSVIVGHSQFVRKNTKEHNLTTIFGSLQDYLGNSSTYTYKITLETESDTFEYEVVSAFKFDTKKSFTREYSVYSTTKISSQNEFDVFYDSIQNLSFIDREISCDYGDKFITLFTCWEQDLTERVVVVAKLTNTY